MSTEFDSEIAATISLICFAKKKWHNILVFAFFRNEFLKKDLEARKRVVW